MSGDVMRIAVVGAGAFGTAVASTIARNRLDVTLFCNTSKQAEEIASTRINSGYFPRMELAARIHSTADFEEVAGSDVVILAVPASAVESYARILGPTGVRAILNLAKGFPLNHFSFAQMFAELAKDSSYVALKGPTFAKPLLLGEPSGLTCGTGQTGDFQLVRDILPDEIDLDHVNSADTVDTLSAMKNIYAIALGIASSVGYSDNTMYLLITKVLREMTSVLEALDLDQRAIHAYCGVGDMLLTGLCDASRNRTLGFMLGRGIHVDRAKTGFLVEGVRSVNVLCQRVQPNVAPLLHRLSMILAGTLAPGRLVQD